MVRTDHGRGVEATDAVDSSNAVVVGGPTQVSRRHWIAELVGAAGRVLLRFARMQRDAAR